MRNVRHRAEDTLTLTTASSSISASPEVRRRAAAPGELVGRYRLIELLGAGGAGEVYKGHDTQLDRPVAIKRLRPDLASSADRVQLAQEARINARLEHPNIVRVYDFVTALDIDYIVSEYVEGASLADPNSLAGLDLERRVAIALALSRGLAFAHASGVVHLDLKAENVLVGRERVPKIADFGIAQLIRSGEPREASGVLLRGTCRSMSPEQTLSAAADARSDLFSFGTLLYELFSGVSPFYVRGHAAETVRRIREHAPMPLRELRAEVPAALSELVQRLHRKNPSERPGSAREVEAVLSELLERLAHRRGTARAEPPLERRVLSIVSCELCIGAPSASLEQAEDYLRTAARFQELLARLVERHEGHVLNAAGHRAVICTGYPRAHDNNSERAARLLLELRREWRGSPGSERAHLRAGLDVGDILLSGELAAGPALSVAAALCDAAHPDQLLVSSRAQRLLRRFFEFRPREDPAGRAAQAGASSSLPCHELVEASSAAGREAALPQASAPVLIGREREMSVLADAWRACRAGGTRSLLVVGAPGVGKSRLLRAFAEQVAASGGQVVCLRARPEDQYSPFAPFSELLARAEHEPELESGVCAREEGDAWAQDEPPGAAAPEAVALSAEPNYRRRIIEGGLDRLLPPSGGRPRLLLVEDVHWLDHSSLALLRSLETRAPRSPLLLVLSGRPESLEDVNGRLFLPSLVVARLSPREAFELVRAVPGAVRLSHRLAMQIVDAADGLPLLLEELTLAVADPLAPPGQSTRLVEVPSSLTESLERRLQALGSARDTLELLAALGREAIFPILERLSDQEAPDLEAHIGQLRATGLLCEEGAGAKRVLLFRHRLLSDAIYERLPPERRRELHRRITAVLQAGFSDWLEDRPDLFAHHFARSGQWLEALELSVRAGERAASRCCHFEACAHFRSALELLDSCSLSPEQRDRWELHLRRLLCPALNASDGWAAQAVRENNEALLALGWRRPAVKPLAEIWAIFAHACLRHDAAGVADALAAGRELPPSPERDAMLAVALGNVEFYRGNFLRAERHLHAARRSLAEPGAREAVLLCGQELLVEVPSYLSFVYAILGQPLLADEQRRQAEAVPADLVVARAFGLLFSTALGLLLRDHESAPGRAAQEHRVAELSVCAERLRHPVFDAVAEVARGRLQLVAGEAGEGLSRMRRGYELYEQTGAQLCLAEYAGFVAEAHLERGEVEVARALLDRARTQSAHAYGSFYRPEFLRIEGALLCAEGREREARRLLEGASRRYGTPGSQRGEPRLFIERIRATLNELEQGSRATRE